MYKLFRLTVLDNVISIKLISKRHVKHAFTKIQHINDKQSLEFQQVDILRKLKILTNLVDTCSSSPPSRKFNRLVCNRRVEEA